MYLDSLLEFSVNQALAADAQSDNAINMFANGQPNAVVDLGIGEDTWLSVQLANTNTADSGTLTVELVTSDDSAMGSPVVLATSGAVDLSEVKDGRVWRVRLPSAAYRKYLALNYKITSATGLVVDAFINKDIDGNTPYASGYSIT